MSERSAFSGGDQEYLRDVQYGNGAKLDVRSHLHRTYSTSPIPLAQFEALLTDWPATATVLECGCGTGRFWKAEALPRSLQLTLTDLSPGMVDEASERARSNGFEAVTGQACDIQALPFDDARFDIVVANHMLYHVPDPDLGVAEIARVMQPDGVALIATNGFGHMMEINEALADVFGSHAEGLYDVFGIDTGEARLRERFASVVWHAFDKRPRGRRSTGGHRLRPLVPAGRVRHTRTAHGVRHCGDRTLQRRPPPHPHPSRRVRVHRSPRSTVSRARCAVVPSTTFDPVRHRMNSAG